MSSKFLKKEPNDRIWWLVDPDKIGEWVFSFDKKHTYNMFSDYPHKLTLEQKRIFDKENPYWANFFSDRNTKAKTDTDGIDNYRDRRKSRLDARKANFDDEDESNNGNGGGAHGNTRLPYGIAKGKGIDTEGMTPKEVWQALEGEGVSAKEEYRKLKERGGKPKASESERTKAAEDEYRKLKADFKELSRSFYAKDDEQAQRIVDRARSEYERAKQDSTRTFINPYTGEIVETSEQAKEMENEIQQEADKLADKIGWYYDVLEEGKLHGKRGEEREKHIADWEKKYKTTRAEMRSELETAETKLTALYGHINELSETARKLSRGKEQVKKTKAALDEAEQNFAKYKQLKADIEKAESSLSEESKNKIHDEEQMERFHEHLNGYRTKIPKIEVQRHKAQPSNDEIVTRLAGGDLTKGSCVSLALAYAANVAGYDVLDFRGGDSQRMFAGNWGDVTHLSGVKTQKETSYNDVKNATKLLYSMEEGKEYILVTGSHAAVVRKNAEGKAEYLELQSATRSGWHSFSDTTLRYRFKSTMSRTVYGTKLEQESYLVDIASLGQNKNFAEMLGYLNTSVGEQKKGASGSVK